MKKTMLLLSESKKNIKLFVHKIYNIIEHIIYNNFLRLQQSSIVLNKYEYIASRFSENTFPVFYYNENVHICNLQKVHIPTMAKY